MVTPTNFLFFFFTGYQDGFRLFLDDHLSVTASLRTKVEVGFSKSVSTGVWISELSSLFRWLSHLDWFISVEIFLIQVFCPLIVVDLYFSYLSSAFFFLQCGSLWPYLQFSEHNIIFFIKNLSKIKSTFPKLYLRKISWCKG